MIRYEDDSRALHTDLYEINMAYTYWKKETQIKAVFEVYYRENLLEWVIPYLQA